jgi:hypothetical protein
MKAITDAAEASIGASLDRMAAGRNATTAIYRAAAKVAIDGLGVGCRNLFGSTFAHTPLASGAAGPTKTYLDSLTNALSINVSFYNVASGAEAGILYSQATGLDVSDDRPLSAYIGANAGLTLSFGPFGAGQNMPHVLLGASFFSADPAQQAALLVHEMLHVGNPALTHEDFVRQLGIPSGLITTFGGDLSLVVTQFIGGGCAQ